MLALIEQLQNAPSGISAEALGKATGQPLSLITAMLEHLERSGQIERVMTDSICAVSKHCRHCPNSKGCIVPLFRLRT